MEGLMLDFLASLPFPLQNPLKQKPPVAMPTQTPEVGKLMDQNLQKAIILHAFGVQVNPNYAQNRRSQTLNPKRKA